MKLRASFKITSIIPAPLDNFVRIGIEDVESPKKFLEDLVDEILREVQIRSHDELDEHIITLKQENRWDNMKPSKSADKKGPYSVQSKLNGRSKQ